MPYNGPPLVEGHKCGWCGVSVSGSADWFSHQKDHDSWTDHPNRDGVPKIQKEDVRKKAVQASPPLLKRETAFHYSEAYYPPNKHLALEEASSQRSDTKEK